MKKKQEKQCRANGGKGCFMKNKIAVSTNSYHGFTVDQALEGIAQAGFTYVELCAVRGWTEHIMPDMSEGEIARIKKRMGDLGLEPVGLSGHCNLMDKDRLKDFEKNIELAHKLGIKFIVSSTGEAHFGEEEGINDDILVKNITTLIPTLEKYDMVMVLELHGVYAKGEDMARITRALNSPYVGINYDTANVMYFGATSPIDDIKTCADQVKFVHLKDKIGGFEVWNFPSTGKGDLPLKEFMEYMDGYDYTGPYSIEIEYTEDYTMRDKDQPGDLEIANQAAKDSFTFFKNRL